MLYALSDIKLEKKYFWNKNIFLFDLIWPFFSSKICDMSESDTSMSNYCNVYIWAWQNDVKLLELHDFSYS